MLGTADQKDDLAEQIFHTSPGPFMARPLQGREMFENFIRIGDLFQLSLYYATF